MNEPKRYDPSRITEEDLQQLHKDLERGYYWCLVRKLLEKCEVKPPTLNLEQLALKLARCVHADPESPGNNKLAEAYLERLEARGEGDQ